MCFGRAEVTKFDALRGNIYSFGNFYSFVVAMSRTLGLFDNPLVGGERTYRFARWVVLLDAFFTFYLDDLAAYKTCYIDFLLETFYGEGWIFIL